MNPIDINNKKLNDFFNNQKIHCFIRDKTTWFKPSTLGRIETCLVVLKLTNDIPRYLSWDTVTTYFINRFNLSIEHDQIDMVSNHIVFLIPELDKAKNLLIDFKLTFG